jgi:radical SAM protein with 4Fe4S-binding SPASM domain
VGLALFNGIAWGETSAIAQKPVKEPVITQILGTSLTLTETRGYDASIIEGAMKDISGKGFSLSWEATPAIWSNGLMENKEEIAYSERFLAMYQQEICKLLLHMLGRLPKKSIPKLIYNRKLRFNSIYSKMGMQRQMASIGHPSGPCLAGVGRLFMDVNGRFFPCERVSETSDVMNIGDVNNGIDIEKAKFLISPGQTTQEQCKKCWAFIMCSSCAGRSDDDTSLSPQKRLYECQFVEQSKLEELKDICFLKLHGYTFEEVE